MGASRNLEGGIRWDGVMLFWGKTKNPSLNVHSNWDFYELVWI